MNLHHPIDRVTTVWGVMSSVPNSKLEQLTERKCQRPMALSCQQICPGAKSTRGCLFHRAKERLQKKSPISLQGFHNLAGIPRCCQMYRSLCFVRLAGCPLSILSIGFGLKPHLQEMTDPIALGFNLSASHPVARQRQAAPATGSGPAEERVTIERMEL